MLVGFYFFYKILSYIYIYTQCGDPHHEIYIEMTKTPIGHGLPVFDEIGDGLLLGFTGFTTL